ALRLNRLEGRDVPSAMSVTGADAGQGAALSSSPAWVIVPPHVSSVQINDGAAQRSRVTSVTITFDEPVAFVGAPENAFVLTRAGGGRALVTFTAKVATVGNHTVVTLTDFSGPGTGGSLLDGIYTLTIRSDQVFGP